MQLLNHHDLQETLFVAGQYLHYLLRHLGLQPHIVVQLDHLVLLRLQIVLNLEALPLLLLGHVLIVTLGPQIVSDSHAQPIPDHRRNA